MSNGKTRGAMFVEVLILAPVISALATVSVLSIKRVSEDTEISHVAAHLKEFAAGFELYALDHGHYPPRQLQSGSPGGSRDEYKAYIDPDAWLHSAPLGGCYHWQDADAGLPAGICIRQFSSSADVLQRLDTKIDDGSLESGQLQLAAGGTRLIYALNAP